MQTAHQLAHIRATLTAALEQLEELEHSIAHVPRHPDAITKRVPLGYDTVLGFLAKHHPEVLDSLDYSDPQVTLRDGYWLMHRTREAGLAPVLVDAPGCLKAKGISHVNAWPLKLLQKRWA